MRSWPAALRSQLCAAPFRGANLYLTGSGIDQPGARERVAKCSVKTGSARTPEAWPFRMVDVEPFLSRAATGNMAIRTAPIGATHREVSR